MMVNHNHPSNTIRPNRSEAVRPAVFRRLTMITTGYTANRQRQRHAPVSITIVQQPKQAQQLRYVPRKLKPKHHQSKQFVIIAKSTMTVRSRSAMKRPTVRSRRKPAVPIVLFAANTDTLTPTVTNVNSHMYQAIRATPTIRTNTKSRIGPKKILTNRKMYHKTIQAVQFDRLRLVHHHRPPNNTHALPRPPQLMLRQQLFSKTRTRHRRRPRIRTATKTNNPNRFNCYNNVLDFSCAHNKLSLPKR